MYYGKIYEPFSTTFTLTADPWLALISCDEFGIVRVDVSQRGSALHPDCSELQDDNERDPLILSSTFMLIMGFCSESNGSRRRYFINCAPQQGRFKLSTKDLKNLSNDKTNLQWQSCGHLAESQLWNILISSIMFEH